MQVMPTNPTSVQSSSRAQQPDYGMYAMHDAHAGHSHQKPGHMVCLQSHARSFQALQSPRGLFTNLPLQHAYSSMTCARGSVKLLHGMQDRQQPDFEIFADMAQAFILGPSDGAPPQQLQQQQTYQVGRLFLMAVLSPGRQHYL